MDIKSLENLAIHCSTKEQHINIIKLLNKIDNREWMEEERNNRLNSDITYKEDTCYGVYRNNFMSSGEAFTFEYCVRSYEWFIAYFTPKK